MFTMITMFYGQDNICTPDTAFADKSGNIYPEAFHPRLNPDGGILDTACINHDYSYVFTVVVPDSFPSDYGNVKLDSIVIEKNGFLFGPKGLTYKCNPPNCKFDAGTLGCIELYGKPKPDNEIKVYDLEIKVKITVLDGILVINDTLPQYLSDSAHYFLPLMEENSPFCQPSGVFDMNSLFSVELLSNPVNDYTAFEVYVPEYGNIEISLTDLQGRMLYYDIQRINEGYNLLKMDISMLKPGIYLLRTKYKGRSIVKKLVIGR